MICFVSGSSLSVTNVYAATKGLSSSSKNMLIHETTKLQLKGISASKVEWNSSNKSVVKVSKGKLTAVNPGKAIVTAKVKGKAYSCKVTVRDSVDLIIFAGQSNMMGHGEAAMAPKVPDGVAYEYKTVTDKRRLNPLKEPFGYKQDSGNLVNGKYCTGSMVSAFCNAYFKQTNTPVVCVGATKVGSGCIGWSTFFYKDVQKRIKQSVKFLHKKGIKINHCYLVWMQGENDVCAGTDKKTYVTAIGGMLQNMVKKTEVEQVLLIQTGKIVFNIGAKELADPTEILAAQKRICQKYSGVTLISSKATTLEAEYYRNDFLHINQTGLNLIGKEAGKNAGKYAMASK